LKLLIGSLSLARRSIGERFYNLTGQLIFSFSSFPLINSREKNSRFKSHGSVALMKISQLSDQALLQQTLILVKKEKEILSEILIHLQEVQRRRLFCELGYGSLFQYCVKQLGYSEDQAYRRINALKLIRELPQVQEQIAKGELTLSSLAVAQSLFKVNSEADKKEVLAALKNKSKREAEVVVRTFSPNLPDRKKELPLSLNPMQEEKWNLVKAKLAHCNLTEEEILERLCDLFLTPKPKPEPRQTIKDKTGDVPMKKSASISAPSRSSAACSIPLPTKRELFRRADSSCSNCGSKYAIQIDHKIPKALGGTNHPRNLRVLCRACNQRAAIRVLGMEKMEKYWAKKP